MKKYLVIGNPIDHSLSPILHNYWIKKNNLNAVYEKLRLEEHELEDLVLRIREKKIAGINVTVPFKQKIIPYLDCLSPEAKKTQSVNTVNLDKGKIVGYNTDIEGFEFSMRDIKFDITNKEILILGAGGVVPSLIYALNKFKNSKITLTNRTRDKAENIKKLFNNIKVIDWGELIDFDMVINATSLGLKKEDKININFSENVKNKFFYDIIYNPNETNFLKQGKKLGNTVENGKMMFIHQASISFKIWHKIKPKISNNLIEILN